MTMSPYMLSGPCITKMKAVSIFLAQGQTCYHWVLDKNVPCLQVDVLRTEQRGWGYCQVWEPQNCISVDDVTFSSHCVSFQPSVKQPKWKSAPPSLRAWSSTGKTVDLFLWFGSELLPQVMEFKYFKILFLSYGKMECEMDKAIGAASYYYGRCTRLLWWSSSWVGRRSFQFTSWSTF